MAELTRANIKMVKGTGTGLKNIPMATFPREIIEMAKSTGTG